MNRPNSDSTKPHPGKSSLTEDPIPASISPTKPSRGEKGQIAHPAAIEHGLRLKKKFYAVGEHAWCLVGNGLSNQTFVKAPQGIIAIDTGECVEEMHAALQELRKHCKDPVVAVIYTHFHYIGGTRAIVDEAPTQPLEIYGHGGIGDNLKRFGGEIAPKSDRGIVHQFGIMLPDEGQDALLHCGLGPFYRNQEHAPFTPGYVPAQQHITQASSFSIGGLQVDITPAPSDATDSLTIWFPELSLCVNNLVWPSLFNIYAIRGEEYRDPRILLQGLDHIYSLKPDALIGTHGPPLSGTRLGENIALYRDAIQFIWDQTVRGANQGSSLSELTEQVQLPKLFDDNYLTSQLYGLVEHHVRQIYGGLFGWFDEDESTLFPLPRRSRHTKLIAGFGGANTVRQAVRDALKAADYRWALELVSWLVHSEDCTPADQRLLASVLRAIAQHTTSANIRNWALTRALEREGEIDLSRHRVHRFRKRAVLNASPIQFVPVLRVLLDPQKALGIDTTIAWHFATGERIGLHIRHCVAVVTNGEEADLILGMSHETWADILTNSTTLDHATSAGLVSVQGDQQQLSLALSSFDHPALQSST
ncbi:MAG: MBL fold metallo-hydrolase [Gammaproteobacteria bacterium]|nr:MBL fold metallo-hydrolase [Gammaproteobacteria bacterium]